MIITTLYIEESGNCQAPCEGGNLGKKQAGTNSPRPDEL